MIAYSLIGGKVEKYKEQEGLLEVVRAVIESIKTVNPIEESIKSLLKGLTLKQLIKKLKDFEHTNNLGERYEDVSHGISKTHIGLTLLDMYKNICIISEEMKVVETNNFKVLVKEEITKLQCSNFSREINA
jgi:hypothetical protein